MAVPCDLSHYSFLVGSIGAQEKVPCVGFMAGAAAASGWDFAVEELLLLFRSLPNISFRICGLDGTIGGSLCFSEDTELITGSVTAF